MVFSFYCDLAVKIYALVFVFVFFFATFWCRARSRRRLIRLNPLNQRHHGAAGRALWRELAAHVSLLKHSRSFALKVSLLPLSVLCDARCCWWCAAACGWRLCRFILQKEKIQVHDGGSRRAQRGVSEDRVPAGHFSFLFEKKSGENHSAHTQPRKRSNNYKRSVR